jgi:coenzyme F420-0:L-glutamate ligase / coenzyme F420-1:gamma-L-glutamate ligase
MRLEVLPVEGVPEVRPGDDLAAVIAAVAGVNALRDGDVLVVAQKIVSKSEGALVAVDPQEDRAAARRRVAAAQAVRVVVDAPQALIVETRHGFVCANAGVDASNVPAGMVALLPEDPDASARRLREGLRAALGVTVGVIVSDTFGRPWRVGQTEVAIGVAGVSPLRDERGGSDRSGAPLEVTVVAVADEIAAAADLVRRKADGVPAVVVRGLAVAGDETGSAGALVRAAADDLFPRGRGGLADALAGGGLQPPGAKPLTDADLRRAVRAVHGVAGADVRVTPDGEVLHVTAGSPVLAGAAAATLLAALTDLGLAARLEPEAAGGVVVRLVGTGPGD